MAHDVIETGHIVNNGAKIQQLSLDAGGPHQPGSPLTDFMHFMLLENTHLNEVVGREHLF